MISSRHSINDRKVLLDSYIYTMAQIVDYIIERGEQVRTRSMTFVRVIIARRELVFEGRRVVESRDERLADAELPLKVGV